MEKFNIKQSQRQSPLPLFFCTHTCFKEMEPEFLCVTCGGTAQRGHFQESWGRGVEGEEPKFANCLSGEEMPLVSRVAQEKIHEVFTKTRGVG